ncbi:GGDEF domain-containing protein [candidate division WOR-3 bacterium]|nr:GGDEF domain-containing protein [candidate division WOR-3 bacterium]
MKRYRPCSFRIESEIGEICDIASKPTIYSISPWVCDECTMMYPACEYLEATVLLGEKNTGGVTASVIRARCRKKNISVNTFTFEECSKCEEFVMKMQSAKYDELTKLYMRDYFNKNARQLFLSADDSSPFSVIFFDLDHFKQINDTYGHQTGDSVLREVSEIIRNETSSSGAACRYGGEEIVVLMPSAEASKAFEIAEKIRKKIERTNFKSEGNSLNVTLSSGISEYPKFNSRSESDLVEQADKALYRAKEEGRNRTYIYDPNLDSEDNILSLEIDFPGMPSFSTGGMIEIIQWMPYPSNPKKIMALKIKDLRTGVENKITSERFEEILRFSGEPLNFSFTGKVENISLSEKRSIFVVKIRNSSYNFILERSISYLNAKMLAIQKSIKSFKRSKS